MLLAVTAGWACAAPDAPPGLPGPLPPAAWAMLTPDTVRSEGLGRGLVYRYLWSSAGPWAIHLVEADLGRRCDVALDVLRAEARERGGRGLERVTSMVERAAPGTVVAVNADFFTPEGATVGPEAVDGVLTASHPRPALAWAPGREPWMGLTRRSRGGVEAGWHVPGGDGDGRSEIVGGFPELLAAGRRVGDLGVAERPGFAATRHPRTAVGFTPGTGRLWVVVVDGRQPPHSSGMTLPELAALFEALGATEALNLDGGGSTVMVVGGWARNRPSDDAGERAVANALALRRDPSLCRLSAPR